MPRYEVRCEVDVPSILGATDEQVEAWVRFNLNENGELRDSPLRDVELEAVAFTVEVARLR